MSLYFNPRPREEGDDEPLDTKAFDAISIHALVKRATYRLYTSFLLVIISIHALVKRATTQIGRPSKLFVYFNPRPREEGDAGTNFFARDLGISIHALVKRATALDIYLPDFTSISIHALVKRATFHTIVIYRVIFYFNPRPREEGDKPDIRQI